MMRNSYDIGRSRQLARMYLRLIALALAVIYWVFLLHAIVRKVQYGGWLDWRYSDAVEMLPFLVTAGLARFFERHIIAWLVPTPKNECPACGYSLEHITGEKCPECGIPLTTRWSDAKPDLASRPEASNPDARS